ncbi:MAG TPA: YihY/virulence factor BrkB family protein [Thermomicrobiales bacterium]|nr:YihY/virulence factor BrkB family protein [Thermomicrobiales bacterium]
MTDDDGTSLTAYAEATGKRPSVKGIAKETFAEFKQDDVPGIAAEIAYHALFAIPPMLIFLIALAAAVNNFTDIPVAGNLITLIESNAPAEMQELLLTLVNGAVDQISGSAAIGLLSAAVIALWSGSNGISALMKAFNRAYDVEEERPFVRKKLVAIGLTILVSVLIIAAFALFVFGEQIGTLIAEQAGLGDAFVTTWQILRWPLAIVFIMFLLAVLYYVGPNVEQSFRWISPGSVLATLLWVAIVYGFSIYLNFSDPGSAYGAVGSVVVLLFFLYLSGIAFVSGAELNAVLGKRFDPETVEDLATSPRKVVEAEDQRLARSRFAGLRRRERGESPGTRAAQPSRPGIIERLAVGAGMLGLAFAVRWFRRKGRG